MFSNPKIRLSLLGLLLILIAAGCGQTEPVMEEKAREANTAAEQEQRHPVFRGRVIDLSGEAKVTSLPGLFEEGEELSSEEAGEYADRDEEVVL